MKRKPFFEFVNFKAAAVLKHTKHSKLRGGLAKELEGHTDTMDVVLELEDEHFFDWFYKTVSTGVVPTAPDA